MQHPPLWGLCWAIFLWNSQGRCQAMMSQETPGLLKPRPRPFLLSRVLSRLSLSTLEAPPRSQLPGHGPSVAVLSLHFLAFGLPLSSAGSPLCSCGPEDLQPGVLVPGGPTTWKVILPQAWLQLKSLSRPHGFNTPWLPRGQEGFNGA